jgi:putative membrane protein
MTKILRAAVTVGLLGISSVAFAEDKLTDPQIAHAAYTADNLDIRYAHLALAVSENPKVREFAELMIRDHSAANASALALVKKLNVTPQDNGFSQSLNKNGDAKIAEFKKLSGAEFDKAYAANELGYHKVVVKTVAESWIPSIQNAEFKKFMTDANEIFKVHESHAEMLVAAVK